MITEKQVEDEKRLNDLAQNSLLSEQTGDEVPWTIQQTFLGIFLTVVPWVAFAFGLTRLDQQPSHAPASPLSLPVDVMSALVIGIFSTIIEGTFLIAPLYFAYHAVQSVPSHWQHILQALGFRRFNGTRTFVWVTLLIVVVLAVNVLYQDAITAFHLDLKTNTDLLLQRSKNAPFTTYGTLVVAVLIAPFCEEIFFRGFVFMGLRRGMPLGWAMFLSALIFAVAHADPASFFVLFTIGLALAFLRWRTSSIWPGMILHTLNNSIAACELILTMRGVLHP